MDKCWTCKVRRKKCDGKSGTCDNCSALSITCYRGPKPSWMDGGEEQAQMAARLKHDVKETSRRRLVVDFTATSVEEPMQHPPVQARSPEAVASDSAAQLQDSPDTEQGQEQRAAESQAELFLSAYFLDKAHPYLCPFYQPSVDHGGRSWIAQLVRISPVYRQVAFCQSYLMQATTSDATAAQEDKMLDMLEHAFGILSISNILEQLVGAVRILASVVQMQRLTLAGKSHEDHLDAAIHLFRNIVKAPALPLAQQLSITEHEAWRWSVGVLLMDDMISSVVQDSEPRLLHYHEMMMTGWELELDSIVGCTSTVALALGKAASLNAWKIACQKDGSLDVMQLSLEATRLEGSLQAELSRAYPPDDILPSFVSSLQRYESARIWAHAALVYLMLVVSGRQLANPKISSHTNECIQLLQNTSTALLPTLLWPILIVGYSTSHQQELQPVIDRLQQHKTLDKIPPIVKLLEHVWTQQPSVDLAQLCREHSITGFPV